MAKVRSYQGTRAAVLVTVLIGGACGKVGPSHESELSDKAGAAGSEAFAGETRAGAGGLAAVPDFGCQFSAHLIEEWLWGRPYDRERGCVDTSQFVAPNWCIVPPGKGSGLVGFSVCAGCRTARNSGRTRRASWRLIESVGSHVRTC